MHRPRLEPRPAPPDDAAVGYEDELRLAYAVALNAVALAAAHRFARRRMGGDVIRRWIDAGLIYYLLQYIVIGALGMMGLLSPWTIGPLALMLCALLWAGSGWRREERNGRNVAPLPAEVSRINRAAVIGCFTFIATYALAYIHHQRHLPPTADDALTYHLPAAVQWLQTGGIGLFPTWFFNPANAYSPLGGSVFMAWLIAPMGDDSLVRFVQLGPLLLMFLVILEISRLLGARMATAALVATAALMMRSFVNQVIVPKDDLFLTVFCLIGVMSLAGGRAEEKWSPWRAGSAIGLLLSMKYTAMFSLPILLLMADVPLRHARWRRRWGWMIAGSIVLALAGPWYVRNALLTGNPLFPIDLNIAGVHLLTGLFATGRSANLGVATLMGGTSFYGPPRIVMVALVIAWLAAAVVSARPVLRDPLARACVVGPVLSIALFTLAAPYTEVRFVYPAIAMLFGCAAIAFAKLPRAGDYIAGGALFALVAGTTLAGPAPNPKPLFAVIALAVTILVTIGSALPLHPAGNRWLWRATVAMGAAFLAGYAFVFWTAYLRQYAADRSETWSTIYGDAARGWAVVERDVPPGSVIAYANTHFVYPLQGFRHRNRVVYAPVRPGLSALHQLPPAPQPLAGEQIPAYFAEQTRQGADARTWRANLVASGADYLFVGKSGATPPPELAFIAERPEPFELLHDNPAAAVYRIRDAGALDD